MISGYLCPSASQKNEFSKLVSFYRAEAARLGIELKLNHEVSEKDVDIISTVSRTFSTVSLSVMEPTIMVLTEGFPVSLLNICALG